jgi:hypothetical protein
MGSDRAIIKRVLFTKRASLRKVSSKKKGLWLGKKTDRGPACNAQEADQEISRHDRRSAERIAAGADPSGGLYNPSCTLEAPQDASRMAALKPLLTEKKKKRRKAFCKN